MINNTINVLWMYPDILNLHGERGNIKAIEIVSERLGLHTKIDRIDDIDKKIDFEKYDFLIFNSGELKCCKSVISALKKQEENLKKFINDNNVIFVTGTSGSIFAKNIKREDNTTFEGLGIFDMDVTERNSVIGDDIYIKFGDIDVIGSQIQMLDIELNKKQHEFGKIKYGYGNNR